MRSFLTLRSLGFAAAKIAPVTAVSAIQETKCMAEVKFDNEGLKRVQQWIPRRYGIAKGA